MYDYIFLAVCGLQSLIVWWFLQIAIWYFMLFAMQSQFHEVPAVSCAVFKPSKQITFPPWHGANPGFLTPGAIRSQAKKRRLNRVQGRTTAWGARCLRCSNAVVVEVRDDRSHPNDKTPWSRLQVPGCENLCWVIPPSGVSHCLQDYFVWPQKWVLQGNCPVTGVYPVSIPIYPTVSQDSREESVGIQLCHFAIMIFHPRISNYNVPLYPTIYI